MEKLKDVCLTCLTNEEDPENGYCINGHDNWLDHSGLMQLEYIREAKIALHLTW